MNNYENIHYIGNENAHIKTHSGMNEAPKIIRIQVKIRKIPFTPNNVSFAFTNNQNQQKFVGIYDEIKPNVCQGITFEYISAEFSHKGCMYTLDQYGKSEIITINSNCIKNGFEIIFKKLEENIRVGLIRETQSVRYNYANLIHNACPYFYYGGFFNGHVNSAEQAYFNCDGLNFGYTLYTLKDVMNKTTINNQNLVSYVDINAKKYNLLSFLKHGGFSINVSINEYENCSSPCNIKYTSASIDQFTVQETGTAEILFQRHEINFEKEKEKQQNLEEI
ncbi:hypothetical protein [Candidatus Gromoviella agglomerans]|uniref:hypothetical protein n=1 Tax=Candidatus Gromoviella agglomerans TaxID=2806609 RepID=UPI001E6264FC|nr:hypothetical protein [Candidatus Gromoviella agglomerans]UFX98269.1 hypothetical protein Gromo_00152 [Candidatus Gromoviella agglomerans]